MLPLFTCVLHFRSPNNHLFEYPTHFISLSVTVALSISIWPVCVRMVRVQAEKNYRVTRDVLLNFPNDQNLSPIRYEFLKVISYDDGLMQFKKFRKNFTFETRLQLERISSRVFSSIHLFSIPEVMDRTNERTIEKPLLI